MRIGRSTPRTGRVTRRIRGRSGTPALWATALAAGAVLLSGCDRIGSPLEALGGRVPQPDEFQVIQYEPPVVPETYSLPEPQPGAPSPRAPKPEQEAIAALYGPGATRAAAAEPTPGEQELLASAGAAAASEEIRVQLEQDRQARPDEPYEPPTIWELLGFGGDEEEIDETQVIDPDTEAARLQAQGIPTPVDPEAEERAAREAAEEAEAAEPEPRPVDRRQDERLGPLYEEY